MNRGRIYLKELVNYSLVKYKDEQFYCRVCDGKNFHYGDCPMPEILKYLDLKTKKFTKLIDGKIPAFTKCPYKDQCDVRDVCIHLGIKHMVPFSCAIAHAYELIKEKK